MKVQLTVRKRLMLVFIVLSGLIYFVSTGVALAVFVMRLDHALQLEISTIEHEIVAATSERNGIPVLMRTRAGFDLPVAIQLYDRSKKMVEHFGLPGDGILHELSDQYVIAEGQRYRSHAFALRNNDEIYGFAQIQVSLKMRDDALIRYAEASFFAAPVVVLGLSIAGHIFAGWAIRPIEQALATLRAFLADAGHELGTPVAIIRTTSENLSLDVQGMPEAEERTDVLINTAERMSDLIKDMMLLATLENPQLPMKKSAVDLAEVVDNCTKSFREMFKQKSLSLTADVEPVTVIGNRSSLERVLTNLLQNALRYTEQGGVTVTLRQKESRAILTVADSGIGIPSESLPKLFGRFYRVDAARSREKGGFGLGLAIVKASIDAHRGTIQIVSVEGKGTTFVISLPIK